MPKQRHIGFVIFSACSMLSARLALFEPEQHVPTAAEERWGITSHQDQDPLGLLYGLRYYIDGIGVLGLLIVAEDYFAEKRKNKKEPNKPVQTTAMTPPPSTTTQAPLSDL